MTDAFKYIPFIIYVIILTGCEDEPVPRDYPRVKTMPLLPADSYEIELQEGGYKVTAGQQINFLSAWEQLL